MSFHYYPYTDLSGYVPYTGATADLNLGVFKYRGREFQYLDNTGLSIESYTGDVLGLFNDDISLTLKTRSSDTIQAWISDPTGITTTYSISGSDLASIGLAAEIGSWGRGENYFEIKYNTGDSDWGKVLYQTPDGYIRNPEFPFTGSASFNFDVYNGIFRAGDLTNAVSGVELFIDAGGGQVIFGNLNTGYNFYFDNLGVYFFAHNFQNTYQISSSEFAFRYGSRINIESTYSTANDGDLWNDSTQKQLATYTNGVSQMMVGTIFTKNGDQTKANSITQGSIVGLGTGTLGLPANFWVAGKSIRFSIRGYKSATATPNITFRIKLDSTVIATTGAIASTNGTNYGWEIEGIITCRSTGSSGTISCSGKYIELITGGAIAGIIQTGTTTINTTNAASLDVSVEWGTANPSNTITSQVGEFTIEN